MQRIEWPTLALTLVCYGLWVFAGVIIWPVFPVVALGLMAVLSALHSSLVHENLHGHPTRNRHVNEALVALPLSLIYPYRRYKSTHLTHHNDAHLTDPFEDPESYYKTAWAHARMPRWLQLVLAANNTMIGRIILGPVLGTVGFLTQEGRLLRANARGVRWAWALHMLALLPVLATIWGFGIALWLYVLAVVWPSLALISVRTYAEHRWHDAPEGRTIIVERTLLSWLFLNNNLHIVHHQIPGAPWYKLPELYAARRAHWHALNQGYVYANYWQLLRVHALRTKEPVVHPVLQRHPAVPHHEGQPPAPWTEEAA